MGRCGRVRQQQAVPDRIRWAGSVVGAPGRTVRALERPIWSCQVDRCRTTARLSGSRACPWQTGTTSRKQRVWDVAGSLRRLLTAALELYRGDFLRQATDADTATSE